MSTIKYVVGDVTSPIPDYHHSVRLLIHCCNDRGGWGRGVVLAISKRWREPEEYYRAWVSGDYMAAPPYPPPVMDMTCHIPPAEYKPFALRQAQFVPVSYNLIVVNMIGQHDRATRYETY